MITAFYVLVFLSIFHFFYESVLAPSLRHGLRYDFFALRDQLRNINIDNKLTKKDKQIYESLDNSICHMIDSMSFVSIGNYYILKNKHKGFDVESEVDKKLAFIESADNKNLISIHEKMGAIGGQALVINNGAWILYLIVPLIILLIISIFSAQLGKLNSKINDVGSSLIYSSDFDDNTNNIGVV